MSSSLYDLFLADSEIRDPRKIQNATAPCRIAPPVSKRQTIERQPFPSRKTVGSKGNSSISSTSGLQGKNVCAASQQLERDVPGSPFSQTCYTPSLNSKRTGTNVSKWNNFISAGDMKNGILPSRTYLGGNGIHGASQFSIDEGGLSANEIADETPEFKAEHDDYDAETSQSDILDYDPAEYDQEYDVKPVSISSCVIPGIQAQKCELASADRTELTIPPKFQSMFPYAAFNKMQITVMKELLGSDSHVVICAPTGSGKTVMLEFAIVRVLSNFSTNSGKPAILYLSPLKSLCAERVADWKEKFSKLGFVANELTGDSDVSDAVESEILSTSDLICSTPEKWDWVTRRRRSLTSHIRLILVDEVHSIAADNRGPTLEAVITRMKMLKASTPVRFVAISATVPNIADIGQWLGGKTKDASTFNTNSARVFHFDETFRPVPLEKVVIGYTANEKHNAFSFDSMLNYKLPAIIETYSSGKPVLVFCMSRKSTESSASFVAHNIKRNLNHPESFIESTRQLSDPKLRQLVLQGVGYHHAGLGISDRQLVEKFFISGQMPVLFSTSTLAVGVNLPAHLVIVKSTWHCTGPMGSTEELADADLLQMIGRAGRPQFDTHGRAVVMTRQATKHRYESLLSGTQMIESYLHRRLVEHLNAELVLGTISTVSMALEWIKETFLYVRLAKNPSFYHFENDKLLQKQMSVDEFLTSLILTALNELDEVGLVAIVRNADGVDPRIKSTAFGRLMARHCIALNTMKLIMSVDKMEEHSVANLIELVSNCSELDDVALRWNERGALNALNKKCKFPIKNGVKTRAAKISVLLQATLGCLSVEHCALIQDGHRIFRVASRVASCLLEAFWILADSKQASFRMLESAILFAKIIRAQMWEDSQHVAKQLPGVGTTLSSLLVAGGIVSFEKVIDTHPSRIEAVCSRHVPFGINLRNAAQGVPRYRVALAQCEPLTDSVAQINVTVEIENYSDICKRALAGLQHKFILIIGDFRNILLGCYRLSDKEIVDARNHWTVQFSIQSNSPDQDQKSILSRPAVKVCAKIISLELVGCDVMSEFEPKFLAKCKAVRFAPATIKPSSPQFPSAESSSSSLYTPAFNTPPTMDGDLSTQQHLEKLKIFSARVSNKRQLLDNENDSVLPPRASPVASSDASCDDDCSMTNTSRGEGKAKVNKPTKAKSDSRLQRQTKIDGFLVPRKAQQQIDHDFGYDVQGNDEGELPELLERDFHERVNTLPENSVQILSRMDKKPMGKPVIEPNVVRHSIYFKQPDLPPVKEFALGVPSAPFANDANLSSARINELKAKFGFKRRPTVASVNTENDVRSLPESSGSRKVSTNYQAFDAYSYDFKNIAAPTVAAVAAAAPVVVKEPPQVVDLFEVVFNAPSFF